MSYPAFVAVFFALATVAATCESPEPLECRSELTAPRVVASNEGQPALANAPFALESYYVLSTDQRRAGVGLPSTDPYFVASSVPSLGIALTFPAERRIRRAAIDVTVQIWAPGAYSSEHVFGVCRPERSILESEYVCAIWLGDTTSLGRGRSGEYRLSVNVGGRQLMEGRLCVK